MQAGQNKGRNLLDHSLSATASHMVVDHRDEATPTPGGSGYAGDADSNYVSRGEPTDFYPVPEDNPFKESSLSNSLADGSATGSKCNVQ
jgi:hypothetical protein